MSILNTQIVHPSWSPIINTALAAVNRDYLATLQTQENWLPGAENIFNAFSRPLDDIRYILFGESPYPRQASANGFAFWDNAVHDLWSDSGLTKAVNRATSLRNLVKMLLVAAGDLSAETSQQAIAQLDKTNYVLTIDELFTNFLAKGFLLLNASLVLSPQPVRKDASAWQPFMTTLLQHLANDKPTLRLLLFGQVAKTIDKLAPTTLQRIHAEHPYNISFIHNPVVLNFFKPLNLLQCNRL